jgi:tetratricopeptide (TPR) repeat protein
MKHLFSIFAALIMAATISAAQTAPANQPPANQPPASQPKAGAPAAQTPGTAPAQGQAPAQAPAGKKRPEAKTQEEFQAFQQAQASPSPEALEKAADAFAQKYPNSELRSLLYSHAMMMYQQQNNPDKLLDVAHKVTAIDPNDPVANVFIATFLPEHVRETDLDKDDKYAEAAKAANTALVNVDNIIADAPPAQVEANKNLIRSMAYASIGTIALNNKEYPKAEENLKKAIDAGQGVNSDPVMYLRYSVALDRQNKYQPALQAANKALELSPQGSPFYNLANQERTRLMQLMGSNPGGAKPATTAPAPPQTQTPPSNPTTPK